MKVIILNSRSFYLNKTADMVSDSVDTVLIQNYTPGKVVLKLLSLIDSLLGTRFRRLKVRQCKSPNIKLHSLLLNDILYVIGNIAIRIGFDKDRVETFVAKQYGKSASKSIHHADILQLRTGYGQGGAIKKAKEERMKIIADHSIACTEEIDEILSPEYKKYGINNGIGPKSEFWKLVIKDCNEADIILVNSDYVRNSFIRHGYEPQKIVVNYLGVREDWFSLKKDYKLINGQMKILFVGEFGIRKGAEYLLKASQILNQKGLDYKITVIGNIADIDKNIKNYDLSHIEFVGTVLYDDLKEYYSKSDVYLFPSLCEGSTRAGMEAMAAGLPVVFTDNCGCPVKDGINGLIVPIKDEYAIADAIDKLYQSENLRKAIGVCAAKTIAENYTWQHYKENLLNLYNSN